MDRFYDIADIIFQIVEKNVNMSSGDGVLASFRSEAEYAHHKLYLESVEALAAPEGERIFSGGGMVIYQNGQEQVRYEGAYSGRWEDSSQRFSRSGGETNVQLLKRAIGSGVSPVTVLTAMELEHQAVSNHGFLFHSAYVRVGEQAILFTGPSGIGKSTQADLWMRLRNAELINGDRSIVRLHQGKAMVYGVPYSGSSRVCHNETLPLQAIVCLSQAPRSKIERLTGLRAFRELWAQCCVNTWNRDDMDQCIQTLMEVIQNVPVYHLACTPDESAVVALETMLKE